MEGLTFRKATPEDTDRIALIINDPPGQEAVAIAGCVDGARRLGIAYVKLPDSPQGWQHTVVGEAAGEVVAVLQAGPAGRNEFKMSPGLVLRIFGILGVSTIPALGRWRARQRVDVVPPRDSYYIEELDVDPAYRNRGVGGAALDFAEADARAASFRRMSLATTTNNPARRLYERHGYRVIETKTDAAYEKYTGIEGRLLMVKELS